MLAWGCAGGYRQPYGSDYITFHSSGDKAPPVLQARHRAQLEFLMFSLSCGIAISESMVLQRTPRSFAVACHPSLAAEDRFCSARGAPDGVSYLLQICSRQPTRHGHCLVLQQRNHYVRWRCGAHFLLVVVLCCTCIGLRVTENRAISSKNSEPELDSAQLELKVDCRPPFVTVFSESRPRRNLPGDCQGCHQGPGLPGARHHHSCVHRQRLGRPPHRGRLP